MSPARTMSETKPLVGKTAVVTGSGRGIGQAIAVYGDVAGGWAYRADVFAGAATALRKIKNNEVT